MLTRPHQEITKLVRYDYFLIWGNGLEYARDIIGRLRGEKSFEILKILKYKPPTIKELVNVIYSYDYAPIEHLRDKTLYLMNSPPDVIFIFLKNCDARETYMGSGAFRHVECMRIKLFKEELRNKYNPRKDGKRTEEHVVHASDNEHQTDHILKYLGFSQGVNLFKRRPNPLLKCPYHMPEFTRFDLKMVHHDQVFCSILTGSKENFSKKIVAIEDTPHFLAISGDKYQYERYLEEFGGILLTDDHSLENLYALDENFAYLSEDPPQYIITREFEAGHYLIMDGVHRSSVLRKRGKDNFIVAVVK